MAVGGRRGLTCRACASGRRGLIRGRWYLSDYWDCDGHGLGYGVDDGPDHAGESGGQRWLATSSSLGLLCGERQEQADPAARDRKPRRSENNAARIRLGHRQLPVVGNPRLPYGCPAVGFQKIQGLPIGGRRRAFCSATSVQCRMLSEQGVLRPDTRPESKAVCGGCSRWCCPALTGVGRSGRLGPGGGLPLRAAGRAWRTGCRRGSPRSWATCTAGSRSRGWTGPRPSGPARPARVR